MDEAFQKFSLNFKKMSDEMLWNKGEEFYAHRNPNAKNKIDTFALMHRKNLRVRFSAGFELEGAQLVRMSEQRRLRNRDGY